MPRNVQTTDNEEYTDAGLNVNAATASNGNEDTGEFQGFGNDRVAGEKLPKGKYIGVLAGIKMVRIEERQSFVVDVEVPFGGGTSKESVWFTLGDNRQEENFKALVVALGFPRVKLTQPSKTFTKDVEQYIRGKAVELESNPYTSKTTGKAGVAYNLRPAPTTSPEATKSRAMAAANL